MNDPDDRPPAELTHLARERAAARAARDFARADELRAQIEAGGWKVVDRPRGGTMLERAAPLDILDAAEPRYGATAHVPSRLDEPSDARFSVVVIAEDQPDGLASLLASLRANTSEATQVVIVLNQPSAEQDSRLAAGSPDVAPIGGRMPEIVRTSARLGHATTINMGIRRASGEIVVLAAPEVEVSGDALGPVEAALADPSVAVAGAFGLASADLHRFEPDSATEVTALEESWLGFRRADAARLGPIDEQLTVRRHLGAWWSLALRAGLDGDAPRRAIRLDLPLVSHPLAPAEPEPAQARLERRNAYRVLEAYRDRPELIVSR